VLQPTWNHRMQNLLHFLHHASRIVQIAPNIYTTLMPHPSHIFCRHFKQDIVGHCCSCYFCIAFPLQTDRKCFEMTVQVENSGSKLVVISHNICGKGMYSRFFVIGIAGNTSDIPLIPCKTNGCRAFSLIIQIFGWVPKIS